jgi:hypothetical protein
LHPIQPPHHHERIVIALTRSFKYEHADALRLLSGFNDTREPSEQPLRQRPPELELKAEAVGGSVCAMTFTRHRNPLCPDVSTHAALKRLPALIRH